MFEQNSISHIPDSSDILGGESGGALDDITFDDGSFDDGEPPNDGGRNGDGSNPPRDPFEENVDQAIASAKGEANRVHHIFENPTHNHYWYVTGLDDEGNWDLIRQTMCGNQDDIESTPDRVPGRVQTNFGTYTVEARYIMVDGILRITDAWVVP